MKQEIIRSEYEPEKKFLWLHTKDGNLVLNEMKAKYGF